MDEFAHRATPERGTANGLVQWAMDAEGNRTSYDYDGHDRLSKTYFPTPSPKGAGTSNASDYEQPTYESLAGGTRTSNLVVAFRNRAGEIIGYGHDALGRLVSKDLPGSEPDVTYGYDLLGRLTSASRTGHALGFTYDALGRVLDQTGPLGTIASEWDIAGRRTKLTWPDGFHVTYDHLVTGETTHIRENGAASGIGVLATFAYDQLGRRSSLTRGNGAVTGYSFDAVSRLQQLTQDPAGTAYDLTLGFAYNPVGQIASTTRSNDSYAWTGHGSGTTSTTSDGLNRLAGWVNSISYDNKGNVTAHGTYGYSYSSENLLTTMTNSATGAPQASSSFAYDPLMRLAVIDSSNNAFDASLGYDGQEIVFEALSNGRTRRYVFGPGIDEPLVAYLIQTSGTTRSWYHADERGSIIAQSNDSGTQQGAVGYDEYGVGQGTSRFHYTGQYFLDGTLHYYRARIYEARLGRFLQPDPIGYGAGMNMYAYVKGDPVNFIDPLGLQEECVGGSQCDFDVWGNPFTGNGFGVGGSGNSGWGVDGSHTVNDDINGDGQPDPDIIITGQKPNQPTPAPNTPPPSVFRRAAQCAADQLGITDLLEVGAIAAGQPIPGSKPYVNAGSSRGTSLAGMAADAVFGEAKLPRRLPTVVGGTPGSRLRIAGTKSVARFAGRAVPVVGWALLAWDVANIAVCTARGD